MDHEIIVWAAVAVAVALGLLSIAKWFLIEVGDFWRWFKQWRSLL